MDDVVELRLSPPWKQAVREFVDANVPPGHVLPISWFEAHFGMEPLAEGATLTARAFRERQFTWLRYMDDFRRELLERHQICLVAVHGEGYKVVPPEEQTETAQEGFEREVKRSYRKAALRLKNVQQDKLTEAQRKENIDAIARLAMLRGMHKQLE